MCPGWVKASVTARFVISLNITRCTGFLADFSSWAKCQQIASPSRSGSAAR
jgi:hypothetical protein